MIKKLLTIIKDSRIVYLQYIHENDRDRNQRMREIMFAWSI